MSQLLAVSRKEFLLWARKPGAWLVIFIVPLLFIWIMYSVFGSSGTPVVAVYVVNEDESSAALRVVDALRSADHIQIDLLETRQEADRLVGAGERMAAVIVPEGFGNDVNTTHGAKIEMIIDPARDEQASVVVGLVNAALGPIIVDAEVTRGVTQGIEQVMQDFGGTGEFQEEPAPSTEQAGNEGLPDEEGAAGETPQPEEAETGSGQEDEEQPIAGEAPDQLAIMKQFFTAALKGVVSSEVQEAVDNPQVRLSVQPLDSQGERVRRPSLLDYLVPGYSLMFVFFLIPNLALTVIEERQTGTLRRLLASPAPRSRMLLGKMLPYFLIAVAQFTFILLVSRLIFGIDLGDSPLALLVIILSSALVMSCLGILIASFARTEGQADGLTVIIVLTMAVVSGAMFPSITIPGLKALTPHYWAMQGFLNVVARGQGLDGVLLPAGILLTMAAVFFMIGAVRFQFE